MDVENLKNIPWNKPYSNSKNLKLYDKYSEEIKIAEKQLYSKEFKELAEKELTEGNPNFRQNTNNQSNFSNSNSNTMSKHTATIQLDGSIKESIQSNFDSHIKKYQQLDILDDKEGLGSKEQERVAMDIAVGYQATKPIQTMWLSQ